MKKSISIIYDSESYAVKNKFSKTDYGLFYDKVSNFEGKQINLKLEKYKSDLYHSKFIQKFYQDNKELFETGGVNFSSMCNKFLLRTFNFFNRESLGNYLTIIDTLEKIVKQSNVYSIVVKGNEDIVSLFETFFKTKKIKYKITVAEKPKQISLSVLSKLLSLRIKFRSLFKIKVNKKQESVFLVPLGVKIDIFKEVRKSLDVKYNDLYFDYKNEFTSMSMIKSIITNKKPYIGGIQDKKHSKILNRIYKKKILQLKTVKLNSLVYKNISLKKIAMTPLNSLFKVYSLLIFDSLLLGQSILEKWETVFFQYNDDPLMESLALIKSKSKKYSLQYELIYHGCQYNLVKDIKQLNLDTEFVWNEYSKNVLTKLYNYPEDKVEVIGNIRFPKVKTKKLSKNKISVVFMSETNVFSEIIELFLDSINKTNNKSLEFFIKPHPGKDYEDVKNRIKGRGVKIIKGNIGRALEKADLVISWGSTTLYEALFNKIPVAILNPYPGNPVGVPYYDYVPMFNKNTFVNFLDNLSVEFLNKYEFPEALEINEFQKEKFLKKIN